MKEEEVNTFYVVCIPIFKKKNPSIKLIALVVKTKTKKKETKDEKIKELCYLASEQKKIYIWVFPVNFYLYFILIYKKRKLLNYWKERKVDWANWNQMI